MAEEKQVNAGTPASAGAAGNQAPESGKKKKGKKKDKPKSKLRRRLLLIFFILLLLSLAAGFCVVSATMNVFGTRDWFIAKVVSLDPAFESLAQFSARLDARERELNEREAELSAASEKLDKQTRDISDREKAVTEREQTRTTIFRPPLSEQDLADMQSLGRIFAGMEPAVAADILLRLYVTEEAAAILYHMAEKSAAAILAEMNPESAARITEILLKE